ncbi:MAG: hypothetical protein WBA10_00490 [Elainellaceae cyanobacterium]
MGSLPAVRAEWAIAIAEIMLDVDLVVDLFQGYCFRHTVTNSL